ncbi:fasciclin [filamentous cyanobacterium CCP5]|nr:fasciclin [filamentous cyanobacterium CCP5]
MADIIDTAVGSGDFKTLVTAIKAADLVKTLKGKGPFTVFAPTDAAFAKLPKGTVDELLKDTPKLKKILTYHVVPGQVMAADVANLKVATTVEGSDVKIDASKGVKINDSTVTTADISADNGVIHVIDTVLMPA